MLFNSWQYAVFLPIVFILYWMLPHRFRWVLLLISSYYFYMSWNAKYVVLILFTTIISYFAAIFIQKTNDARIKKIIVAITLISCLGVLFIFKYINFFFDTINSIFNSFAIPLSFSLINLILPVGISFYTFQTLSYVIDVYRGTIPAEKDFGIYATFVSFFPQLVAGPIERSSNLLHQINEEHRFSYDQSMYGLKLIAVGFFKKTVIADNLAIFVDTVYNNLFHYSGFSLLLISVFFTFQIYCDFSGYSDIARGSAKLFGIELIENFRSPYLSYSIKELWSRWHISLSTWFKDYVYIPLGGNRCGKLRHYFNILFTFLLSGLWHGANWTFVIWGGIHGCVQIFEDFLHIKKSKFTFVYILQIICVFIIKNFSFIFFRSQNLNESIYFFSNMFIGIFSPVAYISAGLSQLNSRSIQIIFIILIYLIPLLLYDYYSMKTDVISAVSAFPKYIRYPLYLLIIMFLFMFRASEGVNFVYFQF